jgi:hypothetical protein
LNELVSFEPEPEDQEDFEPALDTPTDLRPDLSLIGLDEIERGVVEDTAENRRALRGAHMNWDAVYSQTGRPTGLIAARTQEQTKERRVLSLLEKKPLLSDPLNNNSDFLTGLDLIVDESACRITPPWVIGATKAYIAEKEQGGPKTQRRAPAALPHRCRIIKDDGLRCMLWSSGRIKDDGLCRVHLKTQRKPGEDVERARRKLMQSAPYAVDVMEELMETAISEPVRLKAASEILDRAGVRAGMDIGIDVEVTDARSPAQIVAERLARLSAGAKLVEGQLIDITSIKDAEVKDGLEEETSKFLPPAPESAAAEEPEVVDDSQTISQEELDEL